MLHGDRVGSRKMWLRLVLPSSRRLPPMAPSTCGDGDPPPRPSLGGTESKFIPDNESNRGGPSRLASCLAPGLQDLGSSEGGLWEAGAVAPRTRPPLPESGSTPGHSRPPCEQAPARPRFPPPSTGLLHQAHGAVEGGRSHEGLASGPMPYREAGGQGVKADSLAPA